MFPTRGSKKVRPKFKHSAPLNNKSDCACGSKWAAVHITPEGAQYLCCVCWWFTYTPGSPYGKVSKVEGVESHESN